MKHSLTALIVACGLSTWASLAQTTDTPPQPPRPPHKADGRAGRHTPPPLIGALDANHDGVIDATELANAAAALAKLDANGDGQLTKDELMPPNAQPQANSPERRHRPAPLMRTLDANHDGVIDATELANAPAALAKLDANGDGQLSREELMPPQAGHGGGPGPRHGAGQDGESGTDSTSPAPRHAARS